MKLRIKRNLLKDTWDKAVMYRKWQLEAIAADRNSSEQRTWENMFTETLDILVVITTESLYTLHDMATFEAQEMIKNQEQAQAIAQTVKAELEAIQ